MTSIEDVGGWSAVLGSLAAGQDLTAETTSAVLSTILAGEASDVQITAFIVGLRIKGETVDELLGMRDGMFAVSTPLSVPADATDIVGVGGSARRRESALNVSTMACFVAAAAGATICKHGNRKASSTSGSFDLLEQLGIAVDPEPEVLEACIRDVGVGFAFARRFHPAMRHVAAVRTELVIPTVFNVLGPLANPGRVKRQVIGVADASLAPGMAELLAATDSERVLVVTGHDAIDEFSLTGPSQVIDVNMGSITTYEVTPEQVGLTRVGEDALSGGDAATNAAIAREIFDGGTGPRTDMVVLNAAAGLVAAGVVDEITDGIAAARAALANGGAAAKVEALAAASNAG